MALHCGGVAAGEGVGVLLGYLWAMGHPWYLGGRVFAIVGTLRRPLVSHRAGR